MNTANQKGVALITTLILLAVLSAMAVSFIFLSQTETWSTMNYRLMSQARDGAEAGISAASNFILNTSNSASLYALPATTGADLISNYTLTTYPVKYSGTAVILSASPNATANYPYATAQTNFNTNSVGKGSMTTTVGSVSLTVNYATYATLLSMRNVNVYGGATATVQTWLITSDGTINNGVRNATVEVSAILERPIVPAYNYAAFATSNQCSALTISQAGTVIESYDSTAALVGGVPVLSASDGNVGTNGNLNVSSNATIDGSLSTPTVGTGTCVNGAGGASTAETACAGCTVSGGIVELPQSISYIAPALPSPMPVLTAETGNNDCGSGASAIPNCHDHVTDPLLYADKEIKLLPGNYGSLTIGSAMTTLHMVAGTYNMNTFALGNTTLVIDSGPVILNVTGCATLNGPAATATDCATYIVQPPSSNLVVDLSSGAISNTTYNPIKFQIQYAGPGTIQAKCGNTANAATIFAPNGNVQLTSNGTFYGSVIGKTVTVASGGTIAYDRNLKDTAYTVGNWILGGFTWAKF